jgi:hypothetical protein
MAKPAVTNIATPPPNLSPRFFTCTAPDWMCVLRQDTAALCWSRPVKEHLEHLRTMVQKPGGMLPDCGSMSEGHNA